MAGPPGDSCSLEGCDQFLNGSGREGRRLGPRLRGEVGAIDGNEAGHARKDFHPTAASAVGPNHDLQQLERPSEQGMPWVCDSNFLFANALI